MNQDTPPGREPASRRPEEPGAETAPAADVEVEPGKTRPGEDESADARAPVDAPAASTDEPSPADSTADEAPAVIERTVEVRRGGALAGLALLVALAGLAGSGYLWWQQQLAAPDPAQAALAGRQDSTDAKLAALEARIDTLEQAASAAPAAPPPADPRLRTDVDENRRVADGLAGRLDALDARIEALAAAPPPASSPVDDVTAPVAALPPPPGPAWQNSEVELLLRVAQRQAALAGDVETASAALAEADRTIEWLDDSRLLPVRRQIADDLESLRAVRQPDLDGISFRLGSLQARVSDLPVRAGAARGEPEGPAAAEPDDAGLDRLERKSREFLSGLVRVRDSGTDERVFHTPAEAWFLRRNLELELQAARVAILTNNPGAYRDSLAKAGRWTEAYFDPADPGVQAFREALSELAARPVDVEYPDVSGSLRVYLEVTAAAEADE